MGVRVKRLAAIALVAFATFPSSALAQPITLAPGCRPAPPVEFIGQASELDYEITDSSGLNVVLIHRFGQTTLSDQTCLPDPEQGTLSVVVNYGVTTDKTTEEDAHDLVWNRHVTAHPDRRPAEFPSIAVTPFRVSGLPGAEALSQDILPNGVAVFRYGLVFVFPDGAKGLLSASGPLERIEALRPVFRRIGASLRPRRNVQQMEQDLRSAFTGAMNRFVTDRHITEALDLCLTTDTTSAQVQERAFALGWVDGGDQGQQDAAWSVMSALNGAPGLLSVGVRGAANELNCVVAVSTEVHQRFDAELERRGISPNRPLVLSRSELRPASGPPIVIGLEDRIIFFSRQQRESTYYYEFLVSRPAQ